MGPHCLLADKCKTTLKFVVRFSMDSFQSCFAFFNYKFGLFWTVLYAQAIGFERHCNRWWIEYKIITPTICSIDFHNYSPWHRFHPTFECQLAKNSSNSLDVTTTTTPFETAFSLRITTELCTAYCVVHCGESECKEINSKNTNLNGKSLRRVFRREIGA